MIKYYKSGKDFPYLTGTYLNVITDKTRSDEEIIQLLKTRTRKIGAAAKALKQLDVGFYAINKRDFDKYIAFKVD